MCTHRRTHTTTPRHILVGWWTSLISCSSPVLPQPAENSIAQRPDAHAFRWVNSTIFEHKWWKISNEKNELFFKSFIWDLRCGYWQRDTKMKEKIFWERDYTRRCWSRWDRDGRCLKPDWKLIKCRNFLGDASLDSAPQMLQYSLKDSLPNGRVA